MSANLPDFDSLSPQLSQILQGAFEDLWREIEPLTAAAKRDRVRLVIATALFELAAAGQHDTERLKLYARSQALDARKR
jgi:hypothetical protein